MCECAPPRSWCWYADPEDQTSAAAVVDSPPGQPGSTRVDRPTSPRPVTGTILDSSPSVHPCRRANPSVNASRRPRSLASCLRSVFRARAPIHPGEFLPLRLPLLFAEFACGPERGLSLGGGWVAPFTSCRSPPQHQQQLAAVVVDPPSFTVRSFPPSRPRPSNRTDAGIGSPLFRRSAHFSDRYLCRTSSLRLGARIGLVRLYPDAIEKRTVWCVSSKKQPWPPPC